MYHWALERYSRTLWPHLVLETHLDQFLLRIDEPQVVTN